MNVPSSVGVPEIVITLEFHAAVTPDGSPEGAPIPVAPVVLWVMFVNGVLRQSIGDADAELTVLSSVTIIVPVTSAEPHPPERGMV